MFKQIAAAAALAALPTLAAADDAEYAYSAAYLYAVVSTMESECGHAVITKAQYFDHFKEEAFRMYALDPNSVKRGTAEGVYSTMDIVDLASNGAVVPTEAECADAAYIIETVAEMDLFYEY